MSQYPLSNTWTFWIHMNNDKNWAINSYKKITNFNTLESSIVLLENIDVDIIQKAMIFIMKQNINPIWEDSQNRQGGCFCYKIEDINIIYIWKKLCYSLIGNTITSDVDLLNSINGISISVKKNFYIVKIWINNIDNLNADNLNIDKQTLNNLLNNLSIDNNYHYDPFNIHLICNIEPHNSIFKKHETIY